MSSSNTNPEPRHFLQHVPDCQKQVTRDALFDWEHMWLPRKSPDIFQCNDGRNQVELYPNLTPCRIRVYGCEGCSSHTSGKERE